MNLRTTLGTILIIGSLSGLAGCATTPDPAEVCTAEWVQPRAALAIKELRRDTGRTIKSLARNAEKLQNGGSLSAWRAASMIGSVQKLATKIQRGRGVKDLKILAATCDDPAILRDGVVGYLDDIKAPKALMDMIRGFDFEKMTRDAEKLPGVTKS